MRKVFWNGNIIDETEARISIYDSACLFGDTCFEMTRSFNKKQFMLREHLERLFNGLKILRIEIPYTIDDLIKQCDAIIKINNFDDEDRLMINVTRGLLSIYSDVDIQKGSNVIIADFPLYWTVAGMGKFFDEGIRMTVPTQRAIPARYLDPKIKNRSRIHYLIANMQAGEWALLLDDNGFVAEGTGDNFFIIKGQTIITPEGRNILRGISRDYVMWLAVQSGYKVIEKNIELYDVYTADGAFITATPFCMLPVVAVNKIEIGDGKPHKIFNEILGNWSNKVGVNIKKQMQEYDKKYQKKIGITPYGFK